MLLFLLLFDYSKIIQWTRFFIEILKYRFTPISVMRFVRLYIFLFFLSFGLVSRPPKLIHYRLVDFPVPRTAAGSNPRLHPLYLVYYLYCPMVVLVPPVSLSLPFSLFYPLPESPGFPVPCSLPVSSLYPLPHLRPCHLVAPPPPRSGLLICLRPPEEATGGTHRTDDGESNAAGEGGGGATKWHGRRGGKGYREETGELQGTGNPGDSGRG